MIEIEKEDQSNKRVIPVQDGEFSEEMPSVLRKRRT